MCGAQSSSGVTGASCSSCLSHDSVSGDLDPGPHAISPDPTLLYDLKFKGNAHEDLKNSVCADGHSLGTVVMLINGRHQQLHSRKVAKLCCELPRTPGVAELSAADSKHQNCLVSEW